MTDIVIQCVVTSVLYTHCCLLFSIYDNSRNNIRRMLSTLSFTFTVFHCWWRLCNYYYIFAQFIWLHWSRCCCCCCCCCLSPQLPSFVRLSSSFWKSATVSGSSHKSRVVHCIGQAGHWNKCSTECGATPQSKQTSVMPAVMQAL